MLTYLEWKKSYVTKGTFPNYERWVLRFLRFINKDPLQITLEDIGRFKAHLKEGGYAPKNIQYGLSIIRDYIGYLVTVNGLRFPLKLFKIRVERSNSHYPITEREYKKLLTTVSDGSELSIQRRVVLRMMWETGMRIGELLSLKIEDLKSGEAIIENEKNHKNRLIAWSAETEKLIGVYLASRKDSSPYLFVGLSYKNPTKLTSRAVQRFIKQLAKKAEIKNKISPHSFRHGFVHRQLDNGKPITTIAQMLGHSTSLNVLTYAQLSSLEIRKAWEIA